MAARVTYEMPGYDLCGSCWKIRHGIGKVGCQCKVAYMPRVTDAHSKRITAAIGKTGESRQSFVNDAIEIHLKLHEAL